MDQKLFRIGIYRSPMGTQVDSVRLWLTVTGGYSVTYPQNPQNMYIGNRRSLSPTFAFCVGNLPAASPVGVRPTAELGFSSWAGLLPGELIVRRSPFPFSLLFNNLHYILQQGQSHSWQPWWPRPQQSPRPPRIFLPGPMPLPAPPPPGPNSVGGGTATPAC